MVLRLLIIAGTLLAGIMMGLFIGQRMKAKTKNH